MKLKLLLFTMCVCTLRGVYSDVQYPKIKLGRPDTGQWSNYETHTIMTGYYAIDPIDAVREGKCRLFIDEERPSCITCYETESEGIPDGDDFTWWLVKLEGNSKIKKVTIVYPKANNEDYEPFRDVVVLSEPNVPFLDKTLKGQRCGQEFSLIVEKDVDGFSDDNVFNEINKHYRKKTFECDSVGKYVAIRSHKDKPLKVCDVSIQGFVCIHGTVVEREDNTLFCECDPGWYHTQCNLNIDDCRKVYCRNNSTCVDLVDDYRCDCPPFVWGKQCERRCSFCQHGVCDQYTGVCAEGCIEGYGGLNCTEVIQPGISASTISIVVGSIVGVVVVVIFMVCLTQRLTRRELRKVQAMYEDDDKGKKKEGEGSDEMCPIPVWDDPTDPEVQLGSLDFYKMFANPLSEDQKLENDIEKLLKEEGLHDK